MVIQESYPVQADDMTAAGDVSARIKRHMKRLGVPAAVMRRVSVCTYEAEINLVIHSDGGQIDFEIAEDRITVRASDIGPGHQRGAQHGLRRGHGSAEHEAQRGRI